MDFTAEQINTAFDELPKIVGKAMFSVKIDEKITEIINKYKIHLDIGSRLSNYVTLTLIGLIKNEDFGTVIIKDLGLPKEDCEKIINDVNEMIFKPIREKMRDLQESEKFLEEENKDTSQLEEVPLPPYKEEVANIQEQPKRETKEEAPIPPIEIPKSDRDAYAEHGIELVSNEREEIKNEGLKINNEKETRVLEDSGIDIIGDKLIKPTINNTITSDYSIPKMTQENRDVYREAI